VESNDRIAGRVAACYHKQVKSQLEHTRLIWYLKNVMAKTKSLKPDEEPKLLPRCLFCGKFSVHAKRLITGHNNIFYDECVEVCIVVLFEGNKDFWAARLISISTEKNKLPYKMVKIPTKKQEIKRYTNADN
jgi:hypothetical protein